MKSIELTEQHKEKLLLMCRVLFPGHTFSFENDNAEIGIMDIDIERWYRDEGCTDITGSFHWFEFVMTSLVEKLSELNQMNEYMPPYVQNVFPGANGMWNLYTRFHFHYPKNNRIHHPVDYLYEQFKKIQP